ncbi:DUF4116 domain-containing protein [Clostridium intestinale]|uniref:DUF4116 domain-containing protein n=1 Tax=Clostridium intestinale TaxID=36845 RepID=A0A7D6VVT8_9CLOT|nr:DUF4116 domain-containing protein [Clostridium intestinale]QLY81210.1 DUF4116 domain-containing protein [Clostridium intestinale]
MHTVEMCLEAVKQNGYAIRYVSSKVLTYEICLEAVKNDYSSLSYIPEVFHREELYLEAIKHDGRALRYIPDTYKSESVCMKAVFQNGLALEFVPNNIISKEIFERAIEQSGLALKFVPDNRRSKVLCVAAVNNNPLALKYVSDKFKTPELCNVAVYSDWRAFLYVTENMYTVDKCLEMFSLILSYYESPDDIDGSDCTYIKKIVERLPDEINNEKQIIRIERQLKVRGFNKKYFDKENQTFITIEEICYKEEDEIREFDSFIEFYEYLDENLDNADLHDFDFKGINIRDYNIEGAYISSAVLVEQHLYDDAFYSANIKDYEFNAKLTFSAENEVVEAIAVLHDTDLVSNSTLNDNSSKVYYISDIHLDHKLINAFPSYATELEVTIYIRQLVKKMIDTVNYMTYSDYLLIAGDISFNFEISNIFYTELVKYMESKFWSPPQIVVVLGNHELWDFNRYGTSSANLHTLDEIIQQYRNMFAKLDISFLQNDLMISNGTIISEEQLKSFDPDELKYICLKSPFVILGGLGFSGCCSEFNATKGIYRKTIDSLDEDIRQTKRFECIYNKVRIALGNEQVIVLTHTPKENWSNENYNCNWTYVNGHTHRNDYCCNDERTFYSDNQIGYLSKNIGLKHFKLSRVYDIFRYYPDDIYTISREQYLDFNRGMEIKVTFNRIGKIHMLKKSSVYCFLFENPKTGKIYLLNGGKLNNLEHSDINYYFERMSYYSDAIKDLFSGYNRAIKSISNSIKMIGGTGTVHGCIVDIDFFNHIYVNPMDGTITPYFAWSIIDKYEYKDIAMLLKQRRKDLYDNYLKLLRGKSEGAKLLKGKTKVESIEISRFVPETYMYEPSRIMKSLQYLTEVNVIRIWNDHIMDIQPNGKAKELYNNSNLMLPTQKE